VLSTGPVNADGALFNRQMSLAWLGDVPGVVTVGREARLGALVAAIGPCSICFNHDWPITPGFMPA
jgi:hypothetical protein